MWGRTLSTTANHDNLSPMIRSTCLLVSSMILILTIRAQDCGPIDYITPQFAVEVETGVLYGTAPRFDGGTDSLRMNIHRPVGDGVSDRPLLIAVHGGAFIGGDRSDMDQVCSWYAARGYVAATVSYRLGFYPPVILPNPFAYDAAEVVRASYRAQQDVKGAIRFLRERHTVDQSSLENVYLYGVSAGGITAMHVAYATEAANKPAACGAIGPVDHGAQQYQRADLGSIEGLLNVNGYDASVKGCVSYFGGLLDTAFIGSATEPALFTYHQTGDPIVGCGHQQALWGAPLGVGANYPWLYGSCAIDPHMQQLSFDADRYEFHPYTGADHDIHDIPLVDGWAAEFLARQFCGGITSIAGGTQTSEAIVIQRGGNLEVVSTDPVQELRLVDSRGRSAAAGNNRILATGHLASGVYVLAIRTTRSVTIQRVLITP